MQRVSELIFTYLLKFAPYHADGIEYWRAFRRALQILDKLMRSLPAAHPIHWRSRGQ